MNYNFPEYISSFLKEKIELLTNKYGYDSREVNSLKLQYCKQDKEAEVQDNESDRHYHADIMPDYNGIKIKGTERLYRRSMVIEPTTVCAAHCRYCLRSHYDRQHLADEELVNIAKYCGDLERNPDLREVLITGGDPFMIPKKLELLIDSICKYAPNIEIIRIGTRLPLQDPARINEAITQIFEKNKHIKFELALQINSANEIFPENEEAILKLQNSGCRIYCQTVLLKGVNDTVEDMARLFDKLRYLWIEAHYIFHCVPMYGMSHLRTTVDKGLDIIKGLNIRGLVSGRAKPNYAIMSDVGKVILYEGTVVKKDKGMILLRTEYSLKERQKWNPDWQLSEMAELDENGKILIWYKDGE